MSGGSDVERLDGYGVSSTKGCRGTMKVDPLCIGVTGHRGPPQLPSSLLPGVRAAVDRLFVALAAEEADCGGPPPTILTSLAEGADRIVAVGGLAVGGKLSVILPMAAECYRKDFQTDSAQEEFDELCERAAFVRVASGVPTDRAEAYETAGRAVINESHVLLAIWDGEPARGRGGTAQIVGFAETLGRPVLVIEPTAPQRLRVRRNGQTSTFALETEVADLGALSAGLRT